MQSTTEPELDRIAVHERPLLLTTVQHDEQRPDRLRISYLGLDRMPRTQVLAGFVVEVANGYVVRAGYLRSPLQLARCQWAAG